MSPHAASIVLMIGIAALLAAGATHARQSDRNQPMDIDAGHQTGTLDDSAPMVLSQGVVITQGTMHIEAERAEITSRGGDVNRVVLTGSPATMDQEMDSGEPMTARANRIDYDIVGETMVLTGNAHVEQPQGNMRSQRIVYNMQTEQVEAGGEGAGRVQMRIQPRSQRQEGGD